MHFHRHDDGARRTLVAPRHQLLDRCLVTLEHRFDATITQVAHPSGDPEPLGLTTTRVAEPDTLHPPGDHHAPSNHRVIMATTVPGVHVHADLTSHVVRLDEPENLKAFHVLVAGGDQVEELDRLLREESVGRTDDDGTHAWISIQAVRTMAASQVSEDWEPEFERMIAYATGKGWVDDDGTHLRGHLEWAPA